MTLFHLADLHLGKSLYEHDLIDDQRHALKAIIEAARTERPACIIMAGDIFDRAVPSTEAISLLGEFTASLKAIDPALVLAIIPGNHDSATRLSFLAPVLASAGVYIASDPGSSDAPVIICRHGEKARLWLLPFLTPGAFKGSEAQGELLGEEPAPIMRSQADLFNEAMRRIDLALRLAKSSQAEPCSDILVCHAFASGGLASESERSFLGTAELVDGTAFEAFDYVALGHLHRPQRVGSKAQYSGSILTYSFSEAGSERGFLSLQISPGSHSAEFRAISPLRRMIRITGKFDEVLADESLERYTGDYIEAILDDADAVLNPMDALRRRFPFILSLRQASFQRARAPDGETVTTGFALGTISDDFDSFYREIHDQEPEPQDQALFAELFKEAQHEAP